MEQQDGSNQAQAVGIGAGAPTVQEPARRVPSAVLFCDEKIKGNVGFRPRQVRGTVYTVAVLLTWVSIFALLLRLASGPYAALAATLGTALIWIGVALANRVPKRVREQCRAQLVPPGTLGRIRCIGKVRRLARVTIQEAITDRLFEPQVFRATGATKSTGARRAAQIVIGILATGGIVLAQWYFMHQLGNTYLDLMVGIGAAMILGSALFPTYLRVVPGRLDIMECGWLGRKILSVQRIDLTVRPVLVDVNRQIVQVGDSADAPTVAFGAVWNRWEFAHAVLEAAVSTHTPPPLPDDALVG